jgi:hypothetical protein
MNASLLNRPPVNFLFTLTVGKSGPATVKGREYGAIRPRPRQSFQFTAQTPFTGRTRRMPT